MTTGIQSPTTVFEKSTTAGSLSIEYLPNELISHVFGFLVSPKPSTSALKEEPYFGLTRSKSSPLKSVSCVSRRWRQAAAPLLFQHAQVLITEAEQVGLSLNQRLIPFLAFARKNALHGIVISFTIVVHGAAFDNPQINMQMSDGVASFWASLFKVIDPMELLIVAPAQILGYLASCQVFMEDSWNFDCPCHYLQLQRPQGLRQSANEPIPGSHDSSSAKIATGGTRYNSEAKNDSSTQISSSSIEMTPSGPTSITTELSNSDSSPLFELRPWSKLLLNEGSFIRAYATYEWWLRVPPSILPDLVGNEVPRRKGLISPTIRDMSYIGMFPMATHFRFITENFPRLDRFYVQIVPRNDILQDRRKMRQVESADLWTERNNCYAALMRELFDIPPSHNYKHLMVFQSGDAADRKAWNMAVEFVKEMAESWEVESDGVFVRNTQNSRPGDDESDGSKRSILSVV